MSKLTLEQLVEELSALSVLDMSKLKKLLEDTWGVQAAAGGMMMAAAPAAGGGAAAAEEKTEFNVILKEAGANKINVIKAVREITGLGLKEAKDLVDGAPKPVKEGANKAEAEEMKKKLTEAGAVVSVE